MHSFVTTVLPRVLGSSGFGNRLLKSLQSQSDLATVAGWSFAAALVARSANLLSLLICARILSQEQFGQVAIAQSTAGMFGPIAGLGLSMTTVKFLAEYRDTDRVRAGRILGLSFFAAISAGVFMTGALILLAPQLASWGLGSPELRVTLMQSSGLLFFGVIDAVQTGALTGLEAFARIARLSAWNGVISLPIVAALAYTNGPSGAIAGLTIALAWGCLLNGLILRSECRKRGIRSSLAGWQSESKMLFTFSLPAYISGIVIAPVTWMTNALLVQQNGGLAQLALFTAADRFRYLVIFVPISISRIAVPALTRFRAAGNHDGYRDAFRWNVAFSLWITVPAALFCAILSRPLMSLFGPRFSAGWPVLAILALSAVPTVLNTQLGAPLLSDNRAWARAGTDALLALVFLVSAWYLIPMWSAAGLALAFAIAYSCASFTLWICLRHSPARGRKTEAAPVSVTSCS